MATTGFWPVRSSLGAVIAYADNPDKTTNPKYLDDDLAQVLRYAENDDKTDQKLFFLRAMMTKATVCQPPTPTSSSSMAPCWFPPMPSQTRTQKPCRN